MPSRETEPRHDHQCGSAVGNKLAVLIKNRRLSEAKFSPELYTSAFRD